MKYMGSKRNMLSQGLGDVVTGMLVSGKRFADLFAGSGVVSWHVAENSHVEVLAVDRQEYARTLAACVLGKVSPIEEAAHVWNEWSEAAAHLLTTADGFPDSFAFQWKAWEERAEFWVGCARTQCAGNTGVATSAYGGHYFSPLQSMQIDALRATVPEEVKVRDTAIAALITAASECAAAPGHTAQPFQPTPTGHKYLFEAWRRDIFAYARRAFLALAERHAHRSGSAFVGDAETFASQLSEGDLAFIDPPYSGVQYSRFYHVLETVARGRSFQATGVGRYPDFEERPQSDFSTSSKAADAFERLICRLATAGANCVVTYPSGKCSNGLSGDAVVEMVSDKYEINVVRNASIFSTLGGNAKSRSARQKVSELIITGRPRGR